MVEQPKQTDASATKAPKKVFVSKATLALDRKFFTVACLLAWGFLLATIVLAFKASLGWAVTTGMLSLGFLIIGVGIGILGGVSEVYLALVKEIKDNRCTCVHTKEHQ